MNQDIEKKNLEVFSISKLYESYLLLKSLRGDDRSYSVFHPSAFGKCLRKMQYQKYQSMGLIDAPKSMVDPRIIRIWDTGHSMHDRWANYAEDLCILRGLWRCNNIKCGNIHGLDDKLGVFKPKLCKKCGYESLSYEEISAKDEELNFYGHVDQVLDFSRFDKEEFDKFDIPLKFSVSNLPENPVLVDMKTINNNQWKKLGKDCHFYYRVQLVIYLHILDLPYGLLIYEKKDDSNLKIFRIEKDERMWNVIKKQAKLMLEMVDRKMLPPPRPVVKRDMDCNYCEYKEICHSSRVWEALNLDELRREFYEFDEELQ